MPPTQETAGPTETAVPTETTAPGETTVATEETEPPPTAAAPTEPPPTTPAVTAPVPASISYVKSQEPGSGEFFVTAAVTYQNHGLTILQDETGGIPAELTEGMVLNVGELVKVRVLRSQKGLQVSQAEILGSRVLPLLTAQLSAGEEALRIQVRDAVYSQGQLHQGGASVPTVPQAPVGISEGQRVNALGVLWEGKFYIEALEPLAPAEQPLPEVTATPENRQLLQGENIALYCAEAEAEIFYSLSYDEGKTYSPYALYSGGVVLEGSSPAVWIRTQARMAGAAPGPETDFVFTRQVPAAFSAGVQVQNEETRWNFYFGQLHAHTLLLDAGGPKAAFDWAQDAGMDFFGVTEYSHTLDSLLPAGTKGHIQRFDEEDYPEWAAGKAAEVDSPSFVGIYGYELELLDAVSSHISTFRTPGWQPRTQTIAEPRDYYDILTTVPESISQFNHPGEDLSNFQNFAGHQPKYDNHVQLLELGTDPEEDVCKFYQFALDAGWRVAPTANREGFWGEPPADREIPQGRTVALASSLSKANLYDAMKNRRIYAALDGETEVFYTLNGAVMGSILQESAQTIQVTLPAPPQDLEQIQVITEGGQMYTRWLRGQEGLPEGELKVSFQVYEDYDYYYIKVIRGGKVAAVTAPVWLDLATDFGISQFGADKTELAQGERVNITMELYNNEWSDFQVETLEVYLGENNLVHKEPTPLTVSALGTWKNSFPLHNSSIGRAVLRMVVTGRVGETRRSLETSLTLHYQPQTPELPFTDISAVRVGREGELYRIRGYVTAGTSNPDTTFQGQLYLQDETGGIAVSDFWEAGIEIGTPLEIQGIRQMEGENPTLRYADHVVLTEDFYRNLPRSVYASTGMDLDNYGGQLLQIEGKVQNLTRTADGWGVSWFTLRDLRGDVATVIVEEEIRSGSSGENRLVSQVQAGRTVRAIGILQEVGGQPVLLVRNCDEVVYVPPRMDPTNPKTAFGDRICLSLGVLCASAGGLLTLVLVKKRKR